MPRRPAPKLAPETAPELLEVERLAARCRALLPRVRNCIGQYDSLPLCVIDAVWSLSVRYDTVKTVLSRYAAWANLPDPFTARSCDTSDTTVSVWNFIADMERIGIEAFANEVFCNRQRTSTQGGVLKAEAVYRFALALRNHGADSVADIASLRGDPAFERDIFAIPGQRSGISLRYFYTLCGASDLIKPDRLVLAFVAEAIGRGVTPDEATDLLTAACAVLTPECPDLTLRVLDHTIWQYQREEGGSGVQGEAKIETVAPSPPILSEGPLLSAGERVVTDSGGREDSVSPAPQKAIDVSAPLSASESGGATEAEVAPRSQGEEQRGVSLEQTDDTPEKTARYTVRIRELPSDERPRERLIHHGPEALSTAELLAILLRTGTEQRSAVGLAEHLLSEHGGLRGVGQLTVEEMSKIHGLGPSNPAESQIKDVLPNTPQARVLVKSLLELIPVADAVDTQCGYSTNTSLVETISAIILGMLP